jgi:hypothetical protein
MEVNIDKLISSKLSLEGYFILWCLYNEESGKLTGYCNASEYKIPTRVFEQLVKDEYIEFKGEKDFTLDNMVLTDKFKTDVLGLKDLKATSFDVAFQQLREHYPTVTPNGRRLHQDVERCKKLYKNVICPLGKVDEELHSMILQCINFILNQKRKDRSLDYLQMLPTFLSQKNWESVMSDVDALIKKNGFVEKKREGSGGFMDDV